MALVNLADYEAQARTLLPSAVLDYYDGGANDEITLRENRAAFDRISLHYRVFSSTGDPDTGVALLGHSLRMPIVIAPIAMLGMAHSDGDAAAAAAAGATGSVFVLSTASTTPVERVVDSASGPVWFQLYVYKDRGATKALVERVEAAGCSAIQLTADTPMLGRRERDERNSFRLPDGLWAPNLLASPPARMSDADQGSELAAHVAAMFDPGLTWHDVAWLRSITTLPILIKGVVRADDALRALDAGVAGIIVSNHGGRQLDTAPATMDVLPSIADAVAGAVPVLVDGGVRRGTDVVKAIALGATAVQIARPIVWGLAVGGERGVADVLALLQCELQLAMTLTGCKSLADISRDLVRWTPLG